MTACPQKTRAACHSRLCMRCRSGSFYSCSACSHLILSRILVSALRIACMTRGSFSLESSWLILVKALSLAVCPSVSAAAIRHSAYSSVKYVSSRLKFLTYGSPPYARLEKNSMASAIAFYPWRNSILNDLRIPQVYKLKLNKRKIHTTWFANKREYTAAARILTRERAGLPARGTSDRPLQYHSNLKTP